MKRRSGRRAFTLIELMMVILIIGILISMLVPAVAKAMQIVHRARTKVILEEISIGLDAFYQDFKAYPPSKDGALKKGAPNLAYYLRGPGGSGWGQGAGGLMPFGGRPKRQYGPYFDAEESRLIRDSQNQMAGFLDAFSPAGYVGGKMVGRVLYFLARDTTGAFDATDNDVDANGDQGFVNQAHFEMSVKRYAPGVPAGQTTGAVKVFVGRPYVLVSPGLDRKYGYMTYDKDGNLVPAKSGDTNTTCDDVTNVDN